MALDTKYRPRTYDDVLGQDVLVKLCRRFVATGFGRHQSYVFSGPYGSGKTTLGRVLARALLCEDPTAAGDPCDKCASCLSLLNQGSSFNFTEVDAATNSGKAEIQKVIDEISYDEFSGRRRIYLFDEAHQLSPSALDALLKPMEECYQGSEDKRLVCIFCTTEPEKMRATIFSRCAPAMVIQPVPPVILADRLAHICKLEGIHYEHEMLVTLAEMTECHIRDALKAIEGLSMMGGVSRENLVSFMHMDVLTSYMDILDGIGQDLPRVIELTRKILHRASPATCYEKLADMALLAYQSQLSGVELPTYIDRERISAIGSRHGTALLGMVSRLTSRPARPSAAMLLCDLGVLHHGGGAVGGSGVVIFAGGAPIPEKGPLKQVAPPPVTLATGEPVCRPGSRRPVVEEAPVQKPVPASMSSMDFSKLVSGVLLERTQTSSNGGST